MAVDQSVATVRVVMLTLLCSSGSLSCPVSRNPAGFAGSALPERQPAGVCAFFRVRPQKPLRALSVQVSFVAAQNCGKCSVCVDISLGRP